MLIPPARLNEVLAIRRALHQCPEPGFREKRTSAFIRARLKSYGIEHRTMCGTGIVALVRGAKPGPTILFRADMDALPVVDEAGRTKMMHACGHDGHMAMALVAARILQERRARLAGNVKFMFQPAEEGPGGALPMIRAGVLKNPPVAAAFAAHLWNDLPTGKIGVRPGTVFACADEFSMKIVGKGGHGALPHQTVDPVVAAAQVVTACQTLVSRRVQPGEGAVVTFGQVHGGTRNNIIPDFVDLGGTLRTVRPAVRRQLRRDLPRVAGGVAASLGAKFKFSWLFGYPATVNDPAATTVVREVAREVLGAAAVVDDVVTMGAEDMAHILRKIPGCYFFLGSMNRRKGLVHPHHSPRFGFDEDALAAGVEIWVRLAMHFLGGAQ